MTPDEIASRRVWHKRNRIGNCTVDRERWPCEILCAADEIDRLRAGIVRYMADDPPCAADCASMDPYPSRGPCDCGVNEFVAAAGNARTAGGS